MTTMSEAQAEPEGEQCVICRKYFAADLMAYDGDPNLVEPDAYCQPCWDLYHQEEDYYDDEEE